ncbi:Calx-beta domain-containing protein [Candidatus Parabeggiatoa sp. HSG14]|uniref:InlB B-repeat-containing protein n=1 Tax=Candidatus Parabeggiatoa sp. HSG14 TaxID=3055593 RepID=UPI0025A8C259|nr:Calx-beta domain-containing protein [Thiotrichales bacterium HSG14]
MRICNAIMSSVLYILLCSQQVHAVLNLNDGSGIVVYPDSAGLSFPNNMTNCDTSASSAEQGIFSVKYIVDGNINQIFYVEYTLSTGSLLSDITSAALVTSTVDDNIAIVDGGAKGDNSAKFLVDPTDVVSDGDEILFCLPGVEVIDHTPVNINFRAETLLGILVQPVKTEELLKFENVNCVSQQSGDWSAAATWNNCIGSIPQGGYTAQVQNGHTVTLDVDLPTDGVTITVDEGGTLDVSTAINFQSTTTVNVNGTFRFNNGGSVQNTGTTFNYGGQSTLKYDTNSVYLSGNEWGSNTPWNVEIASGTTLTTNGNNTRTAMNWVINGALQIDEGGLFAGTSGTSTFVYGSSSELIFANNSSEFSFGGTTQMWPNTNGPFNVTISGGTSGGLEMDMVDRTVMGTFKTNGPLTVTTSTAGISNLTIGTTGTLQLDSGASVSVSGAGSITHDNGATLLYNSGDSYQRGAEWDVNNPHNVQISNNTTLDLENGVINQARTMAGDLTIDSGSKLSMGAMSDTLAVHNNINIAGTLELSTASGGDLISSGNWTNDGTFIHNNRKVLFFFNSTTLSQTVGGKAAQEFYDFWVGGTVGATVNVLSTDLTVHSLDISSLGVFTAPSSNLNISGYLSNNGTFNHNNGTVIFNGSNQNISGNTTFYNFTKSVTNADTLTFGDQTQTITNVLTLTGTSGNLLSLRSQNEPSQWNIDPQGTRTINFVDVKDSNNVNATPITVSVPENVDSGNNTNWIFLPGVNLSVSTHTGTEAAATVITVTATTTNAVSGNQTVNLAVTGVSASDYNLSNTTITIADEQTTGNVTFTIVNDTLVEGTETATLTIGDFSAGILLGDSTSQNITITDNDSTPPPTPPINLTMMLIVDFDGNGNGSIKIEPAGIDCNSDDGECEHIFANATWISLKPVAAAGSEFQYWRGDRDCSENRLFMVSNKLCIAHFKLKPRTLTMTIHGKGKVISEGKLNNKPTRLDCSISDADPCIYTFDGDSQITLTAMPELGWQFVSWEECHVDDANRVTTETHKICQAVFKPIPKSVLTVNVEGKGDVSSTPAGIHCGFDDNQCTYPFDRDQQVALSAKADEGWKFKAWREHCNADGSVIMDTDKTCQVIFKAIPKPIPKFTLTVNAEGTGNGTVSGAGIYEIGTTVNLEATANADSHFTGWNESCQNGQITITTDTLCSATFEIIPKPMFTLTVNVEGTGDGMVSGAGIYELGTTVKLEATANADSHFTGWNESCQDGQITITTDTLCTATFTLIDDNDGESELALYPGRVQFSHKNYTVDELDKMVTTLDEIGNVATITAVRTEGSDGIITATYATQENTAKAGFDYKTTQGTLTWADGDDKEKTFQVIITDDSEIEGNEIFTVILKMADNTVLDTVTVTIVDNDSTYDPPTLPIIVLPPTDIKLISVPTDISLIGTSTEIDLIDTPTDVGLLDTPTNVDITAVKEDSQCSNQYLTPCSATDCRIVDVVLNGDCFTVTLPLTKGTRLDSTGILASSNSLFYGGIKIMSKDTGFVSNATLTQTDTIAVVASINVAPEHVEKTGEIFVVIQYTNTNTTPIYFYQDTRGGLISWNGDLTTLAPRVASHPLAEVEIIDIYNGELEGLLGKITLFFGYRLETGEIYFSDIHITVIAFPTSPKSPP